MSIFSLEPLALPASWQQDLDQKKHNIELFEPIIKIQPVGNNTSSPLQPSKCKVFQSLRGNVLEVLCAYLFCNISLTTSVNPNKVLQLLLDKVYFRIVIFKWKTKFLRGMTLFHIKHRCNMKILSRNLVNSIQKSFPEYLRVYECLFFVYTHYC